MLEQIGWESTVGQVCLPAYTETAMTVGTDEVDVCILTIAVNLE
jgi:hypothetical protein